MYTIIKVLSLLVNNYIRILYLLSCFHIYKYIIKIVFMYITGNIHFYRKEEKKTTKIHLIS